MKFIKKPIPIEAIRWTGNNYGEVKAWAFTQFARNADQFDLPRNIHYFVSKRKLGAGLWANVADEDWSEEITAAVFDYLHETFVGVKTGQWVMCGTKGEFYPCDDDGTGTAPMNYEPERQPTTGSIKVSSPGATTIACVCGRDRPCGGPHDCARV